jgi:hypothetical protein
VPDKVSQAGYRLTVAGVTGFYRYLLVVTNRDKFHDFPKFPKLWASQAKNQ